MDKKSCMYMSHQQYMEIFTFSGLFRLAAFGGNNSQIIGQIIDFHFMICIFQCRWHS